MDEFIVDSGDGAEVFCRRWLPEDAPRAGVVVVHGAAEHSGRYARVADVLRADGFAVYALDLRGHGRTGGVGRALIGAGGMAEVVSDVGAVIARARAELGDVPIVTLGHSMGSVVVQAFVVGAPNAVAGYVLSGTMGPAAATPEFIAGIRMALDAGMADEPLDALSGYGDTEEEGRTPYDWLSRDPDEVDRYIEDPLCGDDNPLTYGYVAAVLEAIANVMEPETIARIPAQMPVLLLTGDADPVSENGAHVRELERRLRDANLDVTAKYYAGARHEVLNETNRDEVHRDLLAWLDDVTTI